MKVKPTFLQNEFCAVACSGSLGVLKKLSDMPGVDINGTDDQGHTALMLACENGYQHVIKFLLSKKADALVQDSKGNTVLHNSFWAGDLDIFQALVQHGANVNAVNNLGENPIRRGVQTVFDNQEDLSDCLIYLIEQGADLWMKDHVRKSAGELILKYHDQGPFSQELIQLVRAEHSKKDLLTHVSVGGLVKRAVKL